MSQIPHVHFISVGSGHIELQKNTFPRYTHIYIDTISVKDIIPLQTIVKKIQYIKGFYFYIRPKKKNGWACQWLCHNLIELPAQFRNLKQGFTTFSLMICLRCGMVSLNLANINIPKRSLVIFIFRIFFLHKPSLSCCESHLFSVIQWQGA